MLRGRSIVRSFFDFLGMLLLFCLVLAFMRAMNWDPFNAVSWFWGTFVEPISNAIGSNEGFRKVTSAPKVITTIFPQFL